MTAFSYGPISEIPTNAPNVYALRIAGHVDDDASEALAEYMNDVFDKGGKVSMLLDLSAMTGSDWDALLDGDVIESRLRALKHVEKYAVIGAPDRAATMIGIFDKLIPVDARAFKVDDVSQAWAFVGAQPTAPRAA